MKDKSGSDHGLLKLPPEALLKAAEEEIKQLKVEIGKLNAEIDHLNNEIARRNNEAEINKESRLLARKDAINADLRKEADVLRKQIARLRADNQQLIIKLNRFPRV